MDVATIKTVTSKAVATPRYSLKGDRIGLDAEPQPGFPTHPGEGDSGNKGTGMVPSVLAETQFLANFSYLKQL